MYSNENSDHQASTGGPFFNVKAHRDGEEQWAESRAVRNSHAIFSKQQTVSVRLESGSCAHTHTHVFQPSLLLSDLYRVLLKYAQLEKDVQLDLAFVEQLLHLALGLVQLLQHPLDVRDGTAVGRLIGGHGGVSVGTETQNKQKISVEQPRHNGALKREKGAREEFLSMLKPLQLSLRNFYK